MNIPVEKLKMMYLDQNEIYKLKSEFPNTMIHQIIHEEQNEQYLIIYSDNEETKTIQKDTHL